MLIKDFNKLLRQKKPEEIISCYICGKYGSLTDKQLEKIISLKKENHGGIAFKRDGGKRKWLVI